jgi:hypothetical protein
VVALLPGRQLAELLASLDLTFERLGISLEVEGPLLPSRVAPALAPADLPLGDLPDVHPAPAFAFDLASKPRRTSLLVELP